MLGECISSGSNPFYFQKSFLLFHRKIVSIQKKKTILKDFVKNCLRRRKIFNF